MRLYVGYKSGDIRKKREKERGKKAVFSYTEDYGRGGYRSDLDLFIFLKIYCMCGPPYTTEPGLQKKNGRVYIFANTAGRGKSPSPTHYYFALNNHPPLVGFCHLKSVV